MSTRRRPLLVLLAVLAATLAGCSGDADGGAAPSGAQAVLAAAPDRTIGAGSARIAIDAALRGQTRGSLTGEGAFSFDSGRGRLELDLGPLGLAGAGRTEVLLDGDVVFLKLGGALPGLGARPWVRIDLGSLGKGQGDSIEALRQLRANDPRAVIHELRGVTGDAVKVGTEVVRGAETTRYRATVDLDKAAASAPVEVRGHLAEVARQLGTSELEMDAWLDADGLLRRLQYTIDLASLDDSAPAKGTGTGTLVATLELFDFGADVAVEAPAKAETTDLDELLGGRR